MHILYGILKDSYDLLREMAPYLLLGYLFAGMIHVLIDTRNIARHLGRDDIFSVLKASVVGIPLPLCSCGVIPAVASLRKEGASRSAVTSFLVATPTSGVDSVFATYSLLGPFFTLYRVAASFVAALAAGYVSVLSRKGIQEEKVSPEEPACPRCSMIQDEHKAKKHAKSRFKEVFTYAFGDLMADTGIWMLVGVLLGVVISYLTPEGLLTGKLPNGLLQLLIMLAISMPMYICATGSIPVAASLMMKGLNPGAAFVLLFAGPATNAAGMAVLIRSIGKKAFFIYISTIICTSLVFGSLLDGIKDILPEAFDLGHVHTASGIAALLGHVSAWIMVLLILSITIRSRMIRCRA